MLSSQLIELFEARKACWLQTLKVTALALKNDYLGLRYLY